MYLTVDALRSRLRARGGLKLAGGRVELLQRCHEHGLVDEYERLATRRDRDTREAWLKHELSLVGCTLRSDSRLCEAYIVDGEGDAKEVAGVMQAMKFYCEETEYEAIRDRHRLSAEEEYQEDLDKWERDREVGFADRDFRPRFHDYYDAFETSDSAKEVALEAWMREHAGSSVETACEHPRLPSTIRRELFRRVANARFGAWLKTVSRGAGWQAEPETIARPFLRADGLRLADLTESNFEAWFGARIRAHYEVVRARKGVSDVIDRVLVSRGLRAGDPVAHFIRQITTGLLRADLVSARVVCAVKEAVTEHMQKDAASCAKRRVTFAETADRVYGQTWRCTRCMRYVGLEQGLLQHSRDVHGVHQKKDVEAFLVSDRSIFALLTAEAFRDRVLRVLRRDGAARTIQARWRNAIANPEFEACRRRLRREASEFC